MSDELQKMIVQLVNSKASETIEHILTYQKVSSWSWIVFGVLLLIGACLLICYLVKDFKKAKAAYEKEPYRTNYNFGKWFDSSDGKQLACSLCILLMLFLSFIMLVTNFFTLFAVYFTPNAFLLRFLMQ